MTLYFSALVVNKLGTDVLGGTNFLKENDIYSRMAKDTIVIKGNNIFHSTPVQILQMDQSSSKPQLVTVKRSQTILRFQTFAKWLSRNSMDDAVQSEVLDYFNFEDFTFKELTKDVRKSGLYDVDKSTNKRNKMPGAGPHTIDQKKNANFREGLDYEHAVLALAALAK